MAWYRNTGAGWYRYDGTRINRGDVFEPTPDEKVSRRHKLERVSGPEVAAAPKPQAPPSAPGAYVDQYATGGGWYDIPGVGKVQGKAKALEALRADDGDAEG